MEENPQVVPEVKKSGRSFGKLSMLIIIILLALILIGGGYILGTRGSNQPTTQITTSNPISPTPAVSQMPSEKPIMNTYTNTKYGYSLVYPSDWEVLGASTDATIGLAPIGNKDAAIRVDISNMVFDDRGVIPFADYAKVAARNEIQNYTKLSTIKEVTTTSGVVGYETTWEVASLPGAGGGASVSDPITYFPLSSKYGTGLLSKRFQISIENNSVKYESIYQQIIPTLTFN